MYRFWGWLLLVIVIVPLYFIFMLTMTIAEACAAKGGIWRLLGVLASSVIGSVCAVIGYWFGPESGWIFGWIVLVSGGILAILGTWKTLIGIDDKKWEATWQSGKEEAKRILEQDKIDEYDKINLISHTLHLQMQRHGTDDELLELIEGLTGLKQKSEKEQVRQILKRGSIDNYNKSEMERLNLLRYNLNKFDPESRELLEQLWELQFGSSGKRK